ncbi:hypothetical protein AB0C14_20895 [Microbispora hainanensis]|uniref:hypothetical protein n=1 Tax=Microbispora hainanensis TaxID=568844 RepID=UPI003405E1FC
MVSLPISQVSADSSAPATTALQHPTFSKPAGVTGDLREGLLTGRGLLPLLEARGVDL